MSLKVQAKKATAEVIEVTSIAIADSLITYDSLRIGFAFKAGIVPEFCHLSWKTKTSSEPTPMMINKADR